MLGVALLGFADATYLTVAHYTDARLPCTITHGCQVVTTSSYSEIFGIPVALLGALYYLTMFGMLFIAVDKKNERLLRLAGKFTLAGFLFSLWFVFAQIFLIHAICQWCMGSAITSTVLFVLGWFVLPRRISSLFPLPPASGEGGL